MAFDPAQYLQEKTGGGGFDPAAYLAQKQDPALPYTPKPGMMDALGRGFEQGATFGFAPQILAGGTALYDSLFNNADFLDEYEKERDAKKALFKATEQAHPWIYGAGNLAGGAAAAIPLGAVGLAGEGIQGAAALGAASGALQGASQGINGSTAEDTTGQLEDAAKGALSGGILGGAMGGVAGKFGNSISDYLGNLAGKVGGGLGALADIEPVQLTKDAFLQGAGGRRLFGRAGGEALNNEFINTVSGAGEAVQGALNAASTGKQQALEGATDNIDLGNWYNNALGMLKKAQGNNPVASDYADIDKIRGLLSNYILGNEDQGIVGKGLSMSAPDAENLLRKLGAMGSEGDNPLNTGLGKAIVNRLTTELDRNPNLVEQTFLNSSNGYVPLKEIVNQVEGVSNYNQQLSQLLQAKELLPSLSDVANIENAGKSGLGSTQRLNDFFGALPDDLRNSIEPGFRDIAEARKIADKISAPGLSHSPLSLTDTARGLYYKGANAAGLVTKALYDMTPEALTTVAGSLKSIGTEATDQLSSLLSQAAEKDHMSRNALLFAIQQNPKYRALLQALHSEQ